MKELVVDLSLTQVLDGWEYKGEVQMAGSKLNYALVLAIPIPDFDGMEDQLQGIEDVRRLVRIEMTREDEKLELADNEFAFFAQIILPVLNEFYYSAGVRRMNQVGGSMEAVLARFGASVSMGSRTQHAFDVNEAVLRVISAPKFGCDLAA